ncbi:MAG: hypothetical protein IJ497_00285, partial [Clostridia bacterium]|nr:hypothetical protein [Clostridia bacterium]MBQ8511026.1 hypothetical protein [Clostridia bacterium]
MKSRLISASLVLVMLLTLLPAAVMAEGAADGMTISVVSKSVNLTAETVEVDVRIDGNDEGIVTMTVPVTWDNTQLKLTGVTANEEYGLTQLETAREISGWIGSTDYELAQERGVYYLAWDNDLASANHTGDGVLCTMTF